MVSCYLALKRGFWHIDGTSALNVVSHGKDWGGVRTLVQLGADVHATYSCVSIFKANGICADIVRTLSYSGHQYCGRSVIQRAAMDKQYDLLQDLIWASDDAGGHPNGVFYLLSPRHRTTYNPPIAFQAVLTAERRWRKRAKRVVLLVLSSCY